MTYRYSSATKASLIAAPELTICAALQHETYLLCVYANKLKTP
jgi:hypothetical protein